MKQGAHVEQLKWAVETKKGARAEQLKWTA
jgi:hypothetical protein